MMIVELTEDKLDNMIEHFSKGVKCLTKVIDCFEEMKEESRMNRRDSEDDEEYGERYGNRMGNRRGGGRYSRY